MMKKIFAFLVCIIMAQGSFAQLYYTVGNFVYELYSDGVELMGFANGISVSSVVIPNQVTIKDEQYAVFSIADQAFKDQTNITSVKYPSSLTEIGDEAFSGCTSLSSFYTGLSNPGVCNIQRTITSIGRKAFYGCSSIAKVYMYQEEATDKSPVYGADMFADCNVTSAYIYGNVPEGMFRNNSSLTSLLLSTANSGQSQLSVDVGDFAFTNCSNLKDFTFRNTRTIGSMAFANCSSLTDMNVECSNVGIGAFMGCTALKTLQVNIANSLGLGAFTGCNHLQTTTIHRLPSDSYCNPAFQDCTGELILDYTPPSYSKSKNPFSGSAFSAAEVSAIVNSTFFNCMQLEKITFRSPTSRPSDTVAPSCPNLKEYVIAGDRNGYVVADGCVYKRTSLHSELCAVPSGKRIVTLKPDCRLIYLLDGYPGVIDARQVTNLSFSTTFCTATLIVTPEMYDKMKNQLLAYQGEVLQVGADEDLNDDGVISLSDLTELIRMMQKK